MIRVSCGRLSGEGWEGIPLEYGLAGVAEPPVSWLEFTDAEEGRRVLFCSSAGGGSGGNLKSIGGNGDRRAGVRGESRVLIGLFAVDPGRLVLGRSLSALKFADDGFVGELVGGRPRMGFRPARQKPSVETVPC